MSTAVPVEVKKPKQSEVTQITTPDREHQQFIQRIVPSVPKQVPVYNTDQATPITAETPIPPHQVWKDVNAERVGSQELNLFKEEVEIGKRDTKHLFRGFLKGIFGGNTENRYTPANWIRRLKGRKSQQEAQVGDKRDSSQLDTQ